MKELLGSEWLPHNGKRITYKGITYAIRAVVIKAIWPREEFILRADAEVVVGPKATPEDHKYPFRDLIRTYDEEFAPALFARLTKNGTVE